MSNDVDINLVSAIKEATRKAVSLLFKEHNEKFYYCSLITDGEGHCPLISAWSEEALNTMLENKVDNNELLELKWSYADSPYYAFGETFFDNVNFMLCKRDKKIYNEEDFDIEFAIRINSMEKAMAELDKEGLFGVGAKRLEIVINAEVMPPDFTNTERALRLNPLEALHDWLNEAAEFK